MAAIDTYLYLGDEQITGGEIGVKPSTGIGFSATGSLTGVALMNPEFQRVVPSDSGGLTGGNYLPYFDGTYVKSWQASAGGASTISIATAQWKVNHHTGRTVTITAGTGSGQNRVVASNTTTTITTTVAWGTAPDATSVFNLGAGEMVLYHYSPGYVVPGAAGDNWFELTAAVTPMTMLMQRLGRQYGTSAPGFRVLKIAQPVGYAGFKPGQASWTTFKGHYDNMSGIEEGLGNTLNVKAVILDFSTRDIFGLNLAYQADLEAAIAGIRAEISATCLILIVHQNQFLNKTTAAPVAPGVRSANRAVVAALRAAGDTNVRLYDMNWGEFAFDASPAANTVTPPDPRFYDLQTILIQGIGFYNSIRAHFAVPPIAAGAQALASVVMLGDSQLVTSAMSPLMAFYTYQPSLVGTNTLNSVKSDVWIWDEGAQMLVPYDVMSNSSTFPLAGWMGPDVTLPKKLLKRYPQGVVIFKAAESGAPLTIEADINTVGHFEASGDRWTDIKSSWAEAQMSALRDLGRTLDNIGVLISLGENDQSTGETGTAAFETKAADWLDDVDEVFCTRADGFLPKVWLQGPPPASEVDGGSVLGQAEFRNRYRSHLLTLETTKENVKVLRNTGPDTYELSKSDNVHYGGEAVFQIGYDAAQAILDLIDEVEGETGTTEEVSTPSGSATFVVEDGSGLSSANAFCSVSFADTYHRAYGNPISWVNASSIEKQDAIRQMTRWLAQRRRYTGRKVKDTQSLPFPRYELFDEDDYSVSYLSVPVPVQQATAVGAGKIIEGSWTPFPDEEQDGGATSESVSVGPISISGSFAGPKVTNLETRLPLVESLIRPYVKRSRGFLSRG